MSDNPYEFADHLGDGIYVRYVDKHRYEVSVNHHENEPVVVFETEHIEAFQRFKERMEGEL